jgi:hypothetical protein
VGRNIVFGNGIEQDGGQGFAYRRRQETFFHNVKTHTGSHPAYITGTGRHFVEVKRPGRDIHHPSPSCAEVKNEGSYNSAPPIRLYGVDREYATFYLFSFVFLNVCYSVHCSLFVCLI